MKNNSKIIFGKNFIFQNLLYSIGFLNIKNTHYLFCLLFLLFSCDKKKKDIPSALSKTNKLDVVQNKSIIEGAIQKSSKIVLDYEGNFNDIDKVLVYENQVKKSKDSGSTINYTINFCKKGTVIFSYPYTAKHVYEEEVWYGQDDFMTDTIAKKTDRRFVNLSVGYPACGYSQENFLFFLGNKKMQLVHQWTSQGDGPYGDYNEFAPNFKENNLSSFSSKRIIIESDESEAMNEEDEKLVLSYSDSIHYVLKSDAWIKQYKTPKEKVYRKEKTSFKKYFKQ